MKTVLIIFGGKSSEYEVSLNSAVSVINNIPKDKYSILTLGITREGNWRLFEGDVSLIKNDQWHLDANSVPAIITPDASDKGLIVHRGVATVRRQFDVIFPVLHGKNGEDGVIQGLFELACVPYVGCNLISSAICMDKVFTNTLADALSIRQAKWLSIKEFSYKKKPAKFIDEAVSRLGFPIFVKPANSGSSVGINKAKNVEELKSYIDEAFTFDKKILLEEGIDGHEIECAVLGNEEPIASTLGQVIPCNEFYDYKAKYIDESSELIIPAKLSEEKTAEIKNAALKIFKALDCSGLARVDFFVGKEDSAVYFNEINTLPGFTSISMYPKLFAEIGITYPDLIDKLISYALEK